MVELSEKLWGMVLQKQKIKALSILIMAVRDEIIVLITEEDNSKYYCKILKELYTSLKTMWEYSICSVRKLHSLTLEEGTSVTEFTKYIKKLTIQLANVGEFVSKARKLQIMFGVLPKHLWDVHSIHFNSWWITWLKFKGKLLLEETHQETRYGQGNQDETLLFRTKKVCPPAKRS